MKRERVADNVWAIVGTGDLDVSSADDLRRLLADALEARGRVMLDLTQATFIDSIVLSVIFEAVRQDAAASGTTFALVVNPDSNLDRTLTLTGFNHLIAAIYPTRQAVMEAWNADSP